MPRCHSRALHDGPVAAVHDSTCHEPRSGIGVEKHNEGNTLVFTRAGMYLTHRSGTATRDVTAEPAHVQLFVDGAPYRVSHPIDGGDRTTVLAFPDAVAREAAVRHDRAAWRDGAPAFAATHVLAEPAVLVRLHRLRARLAAGVATPLEADESALAILDDVVRASAVERAPTRGMRASTRRTRLALVEAVKGRLAADPGADVSLATLGREVAASPFHLAHTFRDVVGLPVHQYHLRVRLAAALERLDDGATSLGAIALELGFASHAHLTTAFRRLYGVAPSLVRAGQARIPAQPSARFA